MEYFHFGIHTGAVRAVPQLISPVQQCFIKVFAFSMCREHWGMMCLQGLHFLKEDKTNQRLIYKSLTHHIGIKKEITAPTMQNLWGSSSVFPAWAGWCWIFPKIWLYMFISSSSENDDAGHVLPLVSLILVSLQPLMQNFSLLFEKLNGLVVICKFPLYEFQLSALFRSKAFLSGYSLIFRQWIQCTWKEMVPQISLETCAWWERANPLQPTGNLILIDLALMCERNEMSKKWTFESLRRKTVGIMGMWHHSCLEGMWCQILSPLPRILQWKGQQHQLLPIPHWNWLQTSGIFA